MDRHLATKGYDAQQADEPVEAGRIDNLFAPAPGDHGVHGRFDREARTSSWQLAARMAAGNAWTRLRRRAKTAA